jgi:hypothetical protein
MCRLGLAGRVDAAECREHREAGRLIMREVLHDALQGVDTAEPDVGHIRTELIDRCTVPVGDLLLPGNRDLVSSLLE